MWFRPRHAQLLSAAAFLMVAVLGCGSGAGNGGRACTQIGAPAGVSVDVAAELAAEVAAGELEVCWDGSCHTGDVNPRPSTSPTNETCQSGTCSAESADTGETHAFTEVSELPTEQVEVTLTLHDPDGERLVRQTLPVTPESTHPNGPDCAEGGAQAALAVTNTGAVHTQ